MRWNFGFPVCFNGYTSKKGREYGRNAKQKIEATNAIENNMKLPARKNAAVKQEDRDFGRC